MPLSRSPDSIIAEQRVLRGQLVASASILRRRIQPSQLLRGVRTNVADAAADVISRVRGRYSKEIGLVLGGAAAGAWMARAARRSHGVTDTQERPTSDGAVTAAAAVVTPPLKAALRAIALSIFATSLGYLAGGRIPRTSIEREFVGEATATLGRSLSDFLDRNADSMKRSAMNMFGVTRWAAIGLMALAAIGQQMNPRQPAE